MSLLIRNATLVTASDTFVSDLLVCGEKIAALGTSLENPNGFREIDASGCYLMPGGIDAHTHLDMPLRDGIFSSDDFYSGTRAALFGGTTTILDFATQTKGQSLIAAYETWLEKARGKAVCDYGFHLILKEFNESVARDMQTLVELGVSSFKMFFAYPGALMMEDAEIFQAMQICKEIGAFPMVHAENGSIIDVLIHQAKSRGDCSVPWHTKTRPARTEAESIYRAASLAEIAKTPLMIVHLSSKEGLEEVQRARNRGVEIYAETCPQYLFLDEDYYEEENFGGAKYVMCPPLRDIASKEALWNGLVGNSIQTVATDHCPFTLSQKKQGFDDFSKIPNGGPGIEPRMLMIWHGGVEMGRMSLNRYVEVTSTAVAKLFGMYPQKGSLMPGSDADLILLDPSVSSVISQKTHHMNVDYNPYEGVRIQGGFRMVVSRGEIVIENNLFTGKKGRGLYIPRSTFIT